MGMSRTMWLMPEDEDLEDPRRTENRGWPDSVRKSADEALREAERRRQAEIEERRRRDDEDDR